jgi:two-component system, chemotaxis family, protein-glutamate methylesterase/glutaminase
MRILVVDDSIVFRTVIRKVLELEPDVQQVETAPNGRVALEMLAEKTFDLMTLDLNMPLVSGLDVLSELRIRNLKIPVIVFAGTSIDTGNDAFQALSLGARDFRSP